MDRRFAELDAIRGIAALMVVTFHYTTRYGQIYGHSITPLFEFETGKHGVELFFMVSGFVIFMTLEKTSHITDFIVSRLSRLYPAYWAGIILTFSAVYAFSLPGREVGIATAIANLSMLQYWLGFEHVDGVYWTLTLELSFYMLMSFLFVAGKLNKINGYALLWMGLINLNYYLDTHHLIHLNDLLRAALLLEQGNLFIAGIVFFKLMRQFQGASLFLLAIALTTEFHVRPENVWVVSTFFVVFLMFVRGWLSWIAAKPIIFFGSISYSLYLIHQNIGYIVIRSLESYQLANSYTVICAPILLSITIASLMRIYVEQPALAGIRDHWNSSNLRKKFAEGRSGPASLPT